MGHEVPREPLRALVASLSGVPASRVYWDGEPEKHLGPIAGKAGKIVLNVTARAANGEPEERREWNPDTLEYELEYGAQRTLTISVRAHNFLGFGEAYDLLEKVRMGLARKTSRATLRAVDLAYVDTPSIVQLPNSTVDTRVYSAASLDFRVSQLVTDAPDPTGVTGTWIEKVNKDNPPDPASAPVYDLEFTRT